MRGGQGRGYYIFSLPSVEDVMIPSMVTFQFDLNLDQFDIENQTSKSSIHDSVAPVSVLSGTRIT